MFTRRTSIRAVGWVVTAAILGQLAAAVPAVAGKDDPPPAPQGRLRFDRPSYWSEDCARLVLRSAALNRDPGKVERVDARVIAKKAADDEPLTLQEDGPDSGRFVLEGDCLTIEPSQGPATQGDGILQAGAGDDLAAVATDGSGSPVAADIAAVAGADGGDGFVSSVDPTVLPEWLVPTPSGIPGEPDLPIAAVLTDGVPAFFGEDQVIVPAEDPEDLSDFLARRGARLVGTFSTDPQAKDAVAYHVVRLDGEAISAIDDSSFDARMEQAGFSGTAAYSSAQARKIMALSLEEQLGGLIVQPHALALPQAAPQSNDNWFGSAPWYDADPIRGRVRAREALTMMAIADETTQVKLAVVDAGFAGPSDFTPAADPGTYGRPFASVEGCSVNAVGVPTCGAGAAGGPGELPCSGTNACPWHGFNMWSVAGAPLNDGSPGAGSGAGVARPMLYKVGLPYILPMASAITHATLNDADVISISSGFPCRALLLSVCNSFEAGLIGIAACTVLLLVPILGPLGCVGALALLATAPAMASALEASLLLAEAGGAIVSAAAGNAISIAGANMGPFDAGVVDFIPCARPTVVCVGWLDSGTDITHHVNSGFGSVVDVWVPGTNMSVAMDPGGTTASNGTSPAAAFNSGVVAMIRSVAPGLSNNGVRSVLAASRCHASQTARTGGGNCTPSGSARVSESGGYLDVLEAFRRARSLAAKPHMAPCTGGWDETSAAGDTAAAAVPLTFTGGTLPRSVMSGDLSIHAFGTDEDWYRFTPPDLGAPSTRTRITFDVPSLAAGTLRMQILYGVGTPAVLATPVVTGGRAVFEGALFRDERYLVRIWADSPAASNDNCYHSTLTVETVEPGPQADAFEPNDSTSVVLNGWEHTHANRSLASSAETWRMRIEGLTLHSRGDYDRFRFTLPDPLAAHGDAVECGYAGEDELGGYVEHTSRLTVNVIPRSPALMGYATVFPAGAIERPTYTLPAHHRVECPWEQGLREFHVHVNDHSGATATVYDLQIEYRMTILRRVPNWVDELRNIRRLDIGSMGCAGGAFPGCGPDPRSHPFNVERVSTCAPGCTDAFPFVWNARADLSMSFRAAAGMRFDLFDSSQNLVASAGMRAFGSASPGAQDPGEPETFDLSVPGLEPGSYVLLIDGPPGEMEVTYTAPDTDGDGLADALDLCPESAEDPDGIDDGDGCVDLPATNISAVPTIEGEMGWTRGNWKVSFTCEGCAHTEVEVNGDPAGTSFDLLEEGTYEVRYRSVDPGGLAEGWNKITLGIDRTAPGAQLAHGDGEAVVRPAGGALHGWAWDDASGVGGLCFEASPVVGSSKCLSAQGSGGNWTAAATGLAPGVYAVVARPADLAGNQGSSAPVRLVIV